MRINTRYIYVLSIIAVLSLALTGSLIAKADPPGSPPYGAYAYIADDNAAKYEAVGSNTSITVNVSFDIKVNAGPYPPITITYMNQFDLRAKAFALGVSAVALTREYGTNKLLDAGGNGKAVYHSYDGIFCDHDIVPTGNPHDLIVTKTPFGYKITYKYIVNGYYWKHGIFCSDKNITFTLDASTIVLVWEDQQGLKPIVP